MFKVGEKVFDIKYGWGIVVTDNSSCSYPILVKYKEGEVDYSTDGKEYHTRNCTLYHHDYTPTDSLKQTLDSGQSVESNVLTKREKFAKDLFSNMVRVGYSNWYFTDSNTTEEECIKQMVDLSVKCADALIKALNEKE